MTYKGYRNQELSAKALRLTLLAQRAQTAYVKARGTAREKAALKKWTKLSDQAADERARSNPSMFGREAVARARQVKPIRRVGARRVQERDTKEGGEIIGVQPGGFVKVKWDNRERPTLIKRSEIRRYPYLRNPGSLWWLVRDGENALIATSRESAARLLAFYRKEFPRYKWSIKKTGKAKTRAIKTRLANPQRIGNPWACLECGKTFKTAAAAERAAFGDNGCPRCGGSDIDFVSEEEVKRIKAGSARERSNPGLMELAGSVQALEYLADKAGPERKSRRRNPKGPRVVYNRLLGGWYVVTGPHQTPLNGRFDSKADAQAWLRRKNPSTRGGAGRGATTSVTIRKNPPLRLGLVVLLKPARADAYGLPRGETYTVISIKPDRKYKSKIWVRVAEASGDFLASDFTLKANQAWDNFFDPSLFKNAAKRNPTVKQMSQTFQGNANGQTEEFYASDYAPRLDFSRGGKLVFLKLKGTSVRVPGAIVAIDPRTSKLWIAGSERRAMFTRKAAKKGELLDYGPVDAICYLTSKTHVGNGRAYEYVHQFGEEGGRKPKLLIDHDGMPILKGGDYKIEARGIVN